MHLSKPSISQSGLIIVRHVRDFDALVRKAVAAGIETHPCVIARNWATRRQEASMFTAFSASFRTRVSADDVRAALAAEGLRPCTPHEALSFAIDRTDLLTEDGYHVALGYVWNAADGPAVLNVWRSLGRPYVGTSPCEGTWGAGSGWNFLAAMDR